MKWKRKRSGVSRSRGVRRGRRSVKLKTGRTFHAPFPINPADANVRSVVAKLGLHGVCKRV